MENWLFAFIVSRDDQEGQEDRWAIYALDDDADEWVFHINYSELYRAQGIAEKFIKGEFEVDAAEWNKV